MWCQKGGIYNVVAQTLHVIQETEEKETGCAAVHRAGRAVDQRDLLPCA